MKIGFIGCGNMATAMIAGMIKTGVVSPEEVISSNRSETNRVKVQEKLGIAVTSDNREVAKQAEVLVLGVKPHFYADVIEEVKDCIREEQLIVSIAPGKKLAWFEEQFGKKVKMIRTMPNTPAMVGEGMTAVCHNKAVTGAELAHVCQLLGGFGQVEVLGENLMDVVTSVSGSSPAYVFMFIEAMADAAVADGMPRAMAYKFASQAVLGSAKMVIETGMHPGELKDMVCSPAGSTIQAVRVLEEKGMRSAVMEAMKACHDKAKGM